MDTDERRNFTLQTGPGGMPTPGSNGRLGLAGDLIFHAWCRPKYTRQGPAIIVYSTGAIEIDGWLNFADAVWLFWGACARLRVAPADVTRRMSLADISATRRLLCEASRYKSPARIVVPHEFDGATGGSFAMTADRYVPSLYDGLSRPSITPHPATAPLPIARAGGIDVQRFTALSATESDQTSLGVHGFDGTLLFRHGNGRASPGGRDVFRVTAAGAVSHSPDLWGDLAGPFLAGIKTLRLGPDDLTPDRLSAEHTRLARDLADADTCDDETRERSLARLPGQP